MKRKKKSPAVPIREDIREALKRAWPDGVIEMAFDSEDSYFWDAYPKLAASLRRIKGAHLVLEIEAEGGPVAFDDSDSDEDSPDDQEFSRSYHTFFVCPEGKEFPYEPEIESLADLGGVDEDEDEWPVEAVRGTGATGWCVAVSLLAPFAVITLSDGEVFEDGSTSEPSIESHGFTEAGQRIDPEAVSWLRADPGVPVGIAGDPIRVLDALFF